MAIELTVRLPIELHRRLERRAREKVNPSIRCCWRNWRGV